MKPLGQIGLALVMLVASSAALAGHDRHDHRHDRRHYHNPHPAHHYTECKVTRKVTHNGRHYKEETVCKTPKHARYKPHPVPRYHAPPPKRSVHVVHMPPPPPAVVIGPHGVKVHGTVSIGW